MNEEITVKDVATSVRELTVTVQTLSETMVAGFKAIDQRFENVDKRFDDVDQRFDDVGKRFEQVATAESVDALAISVAKGFERHEAILNRHEAALGTIVLRLDGMADDIHDMKGSLLSLVPMSAEHEGRIGNLDIRVGKLEEKVLS